MKNNESGNTEQVLEAISALKNKAENDDVSSEAKDGVDLEAIVKKLSRKREKMSSLKNK